MHTNLLELVAVTVAVVTVTAAAVAVGSVVVGVDLAMTSCNVDHCTRVLLRCTSTENRPRTVWVKSTLFIRLTKYNLAAYVVYRWCEHPIYTSIPTSSTSAVLFSRLRNTTSPSTPFAKGPEGDRCLLYLNTRYLLPLDSVLY